MATCKALPYDVMDVDVRRFDDDFYVFRSTIKSLERRLAAVLTQGFDDTPTIYARFKLLDSFEDLLERPIILDELEKKQLALVQVRSGVWVWVWVCVGVGVWVWASGRASVRACAHSLTANPSPRRMPLT